jgi:hypothetical protein
MFKQFWLGTSIGRGANAPLARAMDEPVRIGNRYLAVTWHLKRMISQARISRQPAGYADGAQSLPQAFQ